MAHIIGPDSPPLAVLPLHPGVKLHEEPNPFEQSFSSVADDKNSQSIPTPASSVEEQEAKAVSEKVAWDSVHGETMSMGMLTRSRESIQYDDNSLSNTTNMGAAPYETVSFTEPTTLSYSQANATQMVGSVPAVNNNDPASITMTDGTDSVKPKSTKTRKSARRKAKKEYEDKDEPVPDAKRPRKESSEEEEKRKNFLERNRLAALKCRQRKKQWLNDLQVKVDYLTNDNERLQMQATALREEIMNLKTLLLAHKNCPVAQANGFDPSAIPKTMPPMVAPPQVVYPYNTQAPPNEASMRSLHVTDSYVSPPQSMPPVVHSSQPLPPASQPPSYPQTSSYPQDVTAPSSHVYAGVLRF
ncbi:uncharacterized protein BYT42DRAFT_542121 [Radiomyces spectabilis]|uniref:uncharacterized protein n=1 Tax=Radiomyces spectabilis TaxID=64574 RepID=UPI00221E53A8|nr:uncharacterized protein BYT42DRAFT_542121 [Radiomyces spectabilis]KAI8393934.1 hypothetical protein BYT42DRAFT_542121 [Radiomyces spectabilis]